MIVAHGIGVAIEFHDLASMHHQEGCGAGISDAVGHAAVDPVGLEEAPFLKIVPDQVCPVPHFIGDTGEPPEPTVARQVEPVRGQASRDEMEARPPGFRHHASQMIDRQQHRRESLMDKLPPFTSR